MKLYRNFIVSIIFLSNIIFANADCLKSTRIAFVANHETMGDGLDVETMDRPRFNGDEAQYPMLSILIPRLRENGYEVEVVSWEDPGVDWASKEFVIIGPVWGYTNKVKEFETWLGELERSGVPVYNSVEFLCWNFEKTYLLDLLASDILVPKTFIIFPDSETMLAEVLESAKGIWGSDDIIIKGLVDAGAFGYMHLGKATDAEARDMFSKLKKHNNGVVVQPFIPEMVENGELNFVFFGDNLSHIYTRIAPPGEERVQPFYGGRSFHIHEDDIEGSIEQIIASGHRESIGLTESMVRIAKAKALEIKSNLNDLLLLRGISEPLYVRIDGVMIEDQFVIMEIEGIEPYMEMQEAMLNNPENDVVGTFVRAIESQIPGRCWLEDIRERIF